MAKYFLEELGKGYVSWMAKVDDQVVSVAGMVLYRKPPGSSSLTGTWGYIMNVYTEPTYRRQGLSTILMKKLTETAAEMGVCCLELHATEKGEPLYIGLGFKKHKEPGYRLPVTVVLQRLFCN